MDVVTESLLFPIAMCLKDIETKLPGIDTDKAKSLAKIKAESLIYQKITHNQFDEIIDKIKTN